MEYLTLQQAAARIPGRPHTSTIWRWCRQGCNGVKLPYSRAGRRIVVTETDIAEFMRALAARDHESTTDIAPKADTAAAERCERLGV